MTNPLTDLTKKDTSWKGGPLPTTTPKPFSELKGYLSSKSFIDYPQKIGPTTSSPSAVHTKVPSLWALSAVLTQTNEQDNHSILAYASCKLQKQEKNYPPPCSNSKPSGACTTSPLT